jgi:hypothetical protein
MSAMANQKFIQLYLQGYHPLQNHPEDCYEGPYRRHRSLRILPHIVLACQHEAAKRLMLRPNSRSSAPISPSLLKKEWGNDRVIMSPFCESAAKWKPCPLTEIPVL